jgi:hypothetical protein
MHLVLFGMQNRTFGPYLAAIQRIPDLECVCAQHDHHILKQRFARLAAAASELSRQLGCPPPPEAMHQDGPTHSGAWISDTHN